MCVCWWLLIRIWEQPDKLEKCACNLKLCVKNKNKNHINDTASDVQVTSLSVTGFGLTCLRGAAQQCRKQAKKNKRATAHFFPFRGAVIMSVLLAALLNTILNCRYCNILSLVCYYIICNPKLHPNHSCCHSCIRVQLQVEYFPLKHTFSHIISYYMHLFEEQILPYITLWLPAQFN